MRRAEIADQLLRSERNRYDQDKEIHDAILIRCHDIRHQIRAMGREGYQEEMREIGKLVTIFDKNVRSENTALDVVLASKCLAFQNKDITFSCIADGKLLSFMSDKDVYALFGNILDNAYEAVSRIEDKDYRQISLSVKSRAGFVMIDEENFFEGSLSWDDGLPQTSKEDKAYHGYGVQSIRMLTEKYGGDFQAETEGNIFRLSLMIPLPQGKDAHV